MNVNFSRSAWHYRLQYFVFGKQSRTNNLCPYFWTTILALLFLPTSILGAVAAPYMDTYSSEDTGRYYNGTRYTSNFEVGAMTGLLSTATILSLLLAGFLLFCFFEFILVSGGGLAALSVFGVALVIAALIKTAPLWWNFLVAAKDKVCPIITWSE